MPSHLHFAENLPPSAAQGMEFDPARLDEDHRRDSSRFIEFWSGTRYSEMPVDRFGEYEEVWLDVGAGTGGFFRRLARHNPQALLLAIERDRMRGKALVKRTEREGLGNLKGYRGNIIPTILSGIPPRSLSRIYLLYPCPWPKLSQRKNRWYLHPIMPFLVGALRPGGRLIWASDQSFYIEEAHYLCTRHYDMRVLSYGALAPNPYNDLERFPQGRTKFEEDFFRIEHPCHELIVEKP